ncbi:MAG: ClpXP protease specificity-enhancing factor SspB [Candidatus Tectimicrobiota bacterium]
MKSEAPANKQEVVLKLLAEGDTMLCLDARHAEARVPPQHATNPALRLILNLNFPQPIEVTAEGISASLSFGGRRFSCYIPMAALWAAFDPQSGQGTMWQESMPEEVKTDLLARQQQTPTEPPAAAARQPRERLRSVRKAPSGKAAAKPEPPAEPAAEAPAPPRQRGHLRIVK